MLSFGIAMPIMSESALLWVFLLGGAVCFASLLLALRGKGKGILPPGPPGLPILGNLLMLGELPHHDLHTLAKKYGPIMHMRLGLVPTIVVSSPQAAQQFLKTHDLICANRPIIEAAKHLSYGRKGLGFTEYGSYWRKVRKLCTLELLSNLKIDHFKDMRREELGLFIGALKNLTEARIAVNLSEKVGTLTSNMISLMIFGKKYKDEDLDEKGFKGIIGEVSRLTGAFNLADYIPYIAPFDLQGLTRCMKAVNKEVDAFFEGVIDEHEKSRDGESQKDFVGVLLSLMKSNDADLQVDRTNIKAILLDMLAGGLDTTAATIEWALSEIFKNPRVMEKVQEELERVVGLERMVEESDLANLRYLEMVVKETLRLHPIAPLLAPHEAMEDCVVNDFHIPKKSRIIINAWAIGRDPEAWPNAKNSSQRDLKVAI